MSKTPADEATAGPESEVLSALRLCRNALLYLYHNCQHFDDDSPEFSPGGVAYEACSAAAKAIGRAERGVS